MRVRQVKTFQRSDGKRRLDIFIRDDGYYEFVEEGEKYEDFVKEYYWAPIQFSGIYGTMEEAERDARRVIQWLRENSSSF